MKYIASSLITNEELIKLMRFQIINKLPGTQGIADSLTKLFKFAVSISPEQFDFIPL